MLIKAPSECLRSEIFISCEATVGCCQSWWISDFDFKIQVLTNKIHNSCPCKNADYYYHSFVSSRWKYSPSKFQKPVLNTALQRGKKKKKGRLLCWYSGVSAITMTTSSNLLFTGRRTRFLTASLDREEAGGCGRLPGSPTRSAAHLTAVKCTFASA